MISVPSIVLVMRFTNAFGAVSLAEKMKTPVKGRCGGKCVKKETAKILLFENTKIALISISGTDALIFIEDYSEASNVY